MFFPSYIVRSYPSKKIPCPPRISNKPHIQVGLDQLFQIQWATGHLNSYSHFVIVPESGTYKLDYIEEAPQGTINLAEDPNWQKRHRTSVLDDVESGILKSEILNTSEYYLEVPERCVENEDDKLYDYNSIYLQEDYYYEYYNDRFPWIESLAKYRHSVFQPLESDITNFRIPGRHGFGKYVVHYVWGGYRDCIDIDLLDFFVENPYGVLNGEETWVAIPHCFFNDYEALRTPCYDAMLTLTQTFWSCEIGDPPGRCRGINIVPFKNPDTVYEEFRDLQLIPWHLEYCNRTLEEWDKGDEDIKNKAFVSYAIAPNKRSSNTEWLFSVTEDPEDPIFYSTCLNREEDRSFEGYESSTIAETNWRFLDHCISCENRQRNIESFFPRFEMVDICVNCDDEPIPKVSKAIPYTKGVMPYFSQCDSNKCVKTLKHMSSFYNVKNTEDCSHLAERDPECSSYFMSNDDLYCYCLTNHQCCLDTWSIAPTGIHNMVLYRNTFDIDTPDINCTRGFKDGNKCCLINEDGSLGYCCRSLYDADKFDVIKNCLETRPCNQYSPPCSLDYD